MKKINKTNFFLILLLIFSFSIRFWQLERNPAGFFCDEALMGIDAFSIIKTGKDSHADFFPLFFKGFNFDNTSPYQVYLTIPFVGLFGLNERAVRLVPVFWSTIELLVFFLLLKEFLPRPFALLGTLLLSISPWHFHLSRINMGDYYSWTLLTLLSYFFLVKGFKTNKLSFFLLSSIFFCLATYSYTPARLTTPLLFGLAILLIILKTRLTQSNLMLKQVQHDKTIKTIRHPEFISGSLFKIASFMVVLYLLMLLPFIHFHLTDPHSFQRIKETMGIDIKNQKMINQPSENFVGHFFNKYLLHYSDTFLFQKGDADFPGQFIRRHSISGLGLLYPYQKWLILAGLIWLIFEVLKRQRGRHAEFISASPSLIFILFLLFLFPLADSLTNDAAPFATRSYLGVLAFHILIAFGIYAIYQSLIIFGLWQKKFLKFAFIYIFSFLIFFSFILLIIKFKENPLTTSDYWGWQYGPREIMNYFLTVEPSYDELYLSAEFNGAEIFLKFYDPENTCRNKCQVADFYRAPTIYNSLRRQLFSLSPDYLNQSKFKNDFQIKKIISYPNGQTAFLIGEVVQGLTHNSRN